VGFPRSHDRVTIAGAATTPSRHTPAVPQPKPRYVGRRRALLIGVALLLSACAAPATPARIDTGPARALKPDFDYLVGTLEDATASQSAGRNLVIQWNQLDLPSRLRSLGQRVSALPATLASAQTHYAEAVRVLSTADFMSEPLRLAGASDFLRTQARQVLRQASAAWQRGDAALP
jgi:hypothetical protein